MVQCVVQCVIQCVVQGAVQCVIQCPMQCNLALTNGHDLMQPNHCSTAALKSLGMSLLSLVLLLFSLGTLESRDSRE